MATQYLISGVSGNSRSRPFPRMKASDSLSRIMGMDFFIPFPFPNFGNVFFHSLPVPEFWECLFSFPSRSRILGMDFFIPFPFPNFGNGNFSFPSRSRIDHFKVGNQKGKWKIVRDASIFSFLYISYYIKMGVLKSKSHIAVLLAPSGALVVIMVY